MKFCLGSVCWGGYLERYINMFANNYIRLFRELISYGVNYTDIADPKVSCSGEVIGEAVEQAVQKIKIATNKKLEIVQNKKTYTEQTIMYSTRNNLRLAFKKEFPNEPKVFFIFQ
jgi:mRNA degradation ribonuclease J1/J2